jgi:hypothetical protein
LENFGRSDLFDRTLGHQAGQVFEEPLGFGDGGRRGLLFLHSLDVFLGDQAEGGACFRDGCDLLLFAFGGGVDAAD